jgi:hypothetical protein
MAELWSELKDDVLDVLKDSVRDFVDVESDEAKEILGEISERAAKQTYLLVNGSDVEKVQAPGNIRSLKAQAIIAAATLVVTGSAELRAAFVKVVETVGNFLLKNAPKLIAAL